MDAYQHALKIAADVDGRRLDLARDLLATGNGVVLLEHCVALRSEGYRIVCEVLTRLPTGARDNEGFEAEIATARRALEASTIYAAVDGCELEWIVVENDGMGTARLWPPPALNATPTRGR